MTSNEGPATMPAAGTFDVIIYHNPACGTSRNTLALIRNAGIEPHVVEYLKTPPSRELLVQLLQRAEMTPRELLREKGTPFQELGLSDPGLSDEQLMDAMMKNPVLINRPLVVSPRGVKLCRPSEVVLDLLPAVPMSSFTKEDGEQVITADGTRVKEYANGNAGVAGRKARDNTLRALSLFVGGALHLRRDRPRGGGPRTLPGRCRS